MAILAVAKFGPRWVWGDADCVTGLASLHLDLTRLVGRHAAISHLVTLMGPTYPISISLGLRKYR